MDKKGFIEYLESKDHAKSTQKEYLLRSKLFLDWVQKEDLQITKPDILNYLEYLKNRKNNNNPTRAITLTAIRHYFDYLFKNEYIPKNPATFLKIRGTQVKKLYHLYTGEELEELYDTFYHIYIRGFESNKYFGHDTEEKIKLTRERSLIALGILVYQGVQTSELKNIKLEDVDLQKAKIKIPSSKQAAERILPLKAAQIGSLIRYMEYVKPELEDMFPKAVESEYLFSVEKDFVQHLIRLTREIDKRFRNFRQVRTSVITNWLKTENLRKAQHLAGHRSINATENYQPNNLESLIEDITKHHPLL
jgi:site-specific recombinase XerD